MSLDKKKKQVDLLRCQASKAELELKVEEKMEEVERLKVHIALQEQKEQELTEELKSL